MSDWHTIDIDSNGVSIRVTRTGGNLPPLLLSHGLTDCGLCWSRFTEAVENRYDVLMVDTRNHGHSGSGPAGLAELTGDLASVVNALGVAPVRAIGHSVGAAVMAAFAARYPALVSQLVLEDPPWRAGPSKPVSEKRSAARSDAFRAFVESQAALSDAEIQAQGEADHPSWSDVEWPSWVASNRQVRPDAMAQLDLGDWRDSAPAIRCPTLLLYGDPQRDGIVSDETAAQIAGTNAHITPALIQGGGHNLRREAFERYVDVVTGFLAGP